jgi:hypothetical protein
MASCWAVNATSFDRVLMRQQTGRWGKLARRDVLALDYGGNQTGPEGPCSITGEGVLSEARGDTQQRGWMSRRAFLSSSAAAGAATVAFGGTAQAGTAPLDDVEAMVLQVAAAAAVFPIRLETYERESASARLTTQRVGRAKGRVSSGRALQAERGARLLLDRGLGGAETKELLMQLGDIVANGGKQEVADVTALVAVAGATLADRVDPDTDLQASLWLRGLAIMNRRGVTPVVGG